MHGVPELIAKALSFALIKTALREKRNCYLISFSTHIQTINLLDLTQSLEKLVEFLEFSFRGGTDITHAFEEALNMFEQNDYQKADVLVITDGIMRPVSESQRRVINSYQAKENKFYCIIIGDSGNLDFESIFDQVWHLGSDKKTGLFDIVKQI